MPRSYDYALPKKMFSGALRSALSVKAAQQKLTVVEEWALETHKTKALRQSLGKLDGETRTILLVENAPSVNLERASRNLDGVTLLPTANLDTYDLMRHDHLMLSREAALKLSRGLSADKGESGDGARGIGAEASWQPKQPREPEERRQGSRASESKGGRENREKAGG